MPTGQNGYVPTFQYGVDNLDAANRQVIGMQNPYEGINTLDDAVRKFGLSKSVSSAFNPAKANLATQRARGMQRAAIRGGDSATPERAFGDVESQYADASGGLESTQAQAQLGQTNKLADFFNSILGQKSDFGFKQAGFRANVAGQMAGAGLGQDQYEQSNESPGFLDFLSSIMGAAAPIVGAALMGPAGAVLGGAAASGGSGGGRGTH
jgi:hypothetical protein